MLLLGLTAPAQAAPPVGPAAAALNKIAPAQAPAAKAPKVAAKPVTGSPAQAKQGSIAKRQPGLSNSGGVSTLNCCGGPWYYYQVGSQTFTSGYPTALSANTKAFVPYLDTDDYHTLTEIAGIKKINADGTLKRNIVEIGITVDDALNGDYDQHLFSFWWKNGNGQGYNTGTGFVPYVSTPTNPITLGMTIPYGATVKLGMQYDTGNWWLWAAVSTVDSGATHWVGYYPGTLWSASNAYGPAVSGFTNFDNPQAFNEVAAGNIDGSGNAFKPCTDSGGILPDMWSQPSDTDYISTVRYQSGASVPSMTWAVANPAPFPTFAGYGLYQTNSSSAYVGGEGADAVGNLPGNVGWC